MHTRALAVVVMVLALTSACGDDDSGGGGDAAATTPIETEQPDLPPETTTNSGPTISSEGGDATAPASGSSDAAPGDCPNDSVVSTAVGREMVTDTNGRTPGFFCPYREAAADDVTVSVTFTPLDITQGTGPDTEVVTGVGEQAIWEDTTGALSVWTGESGVIVSVLAFDDAVDEQAVAIALAETIVSG